MDSTDGRILRAPMRRKRNDEQLCDRINLNLRPYWIERKLQPNTLPEVPGHSREVGNERAFKVAREAINAAEGSKAIGPVGISMLQPNTDAEKPW
ncbi:hypothetical protein FF38_09012 [Lucilia cuprina]|uniref:Uncharacterized protein n=1 Tax=Lucilia cuprina TaxID=7375 RepID=A0A0L0C233_LUCCU|nr:hypothetical protein FF38_09012 [Lucilia cuprina]